MTEHEQPAGWYPTPDPALRDRFARYWDGTAWTDHQIELDPPAKPAAPKKVPPAALTPPKPDSQPAATRSARRFTWLPKTIIALAVALVLSVLAFESIDASGPIGYSLSNETTPANALINAPELRVSRGNQFEQLRMSARRHGFLTRFTVVTWSLQEPLTIELIPAYPGESGHTFVIDLRQGGANTLNQDWYLRVDVVATDQAFEIEINQPVASGFQRSREVVQRTTIPRSNERRIVEALEAEAQERAAAIAARQACVREERESQSELTQLTVSLPQRYATSLDSRRIYGTATLTFDEYRRRIRNLAGDMADHLRDAELALDQLPEDVPRRELNDALATYAELRDAWLSFERALRTVRSGPGNTFQDLYPSEAGAIERLELAVPTTAASAQAATGGARRDIVATICEERHPMP